MRPYLAKFVLWLEQPADGVLDLSNISVLCISLSALLMGKMEAERRRSNDLAECYSYKLRFHVPDSRFSNSGKYFLTNENTRLFNSLVRQHFKEHLKHRVEMDKKLHGICEAHSIYNFMAELDIIDDVSFDALKRSLARDRKKKKHVERIS